MAKSEALLVQEKQRAYRERDALLVAFSKVFPSHLMPDDGRPKRYITGSHQWVVCIHAPVGQLCWHIADEMLPQFDHLARMEENHWDGHTTAERHLRLALLEPQDGSAYDPTPPVARRRHGKDHP